MEQRIVKHLKPKGEAESVWLKQASTFVTEQLLPVIRGSTPADQSANQSPECCAQVSADLSVCVLKTIQEHTHTNCLPVSYRLVSVSELLTRQRLSCVSNLSWSTNQQRVWEKEAELLLPDRCPLPRVNLLLIGCLRAGRGGAWRLTDASGSVRCECVSPSPLWLNQPVFLPHWNYIPHDAAGQGGHEDEGHVELIGSPALLCPELGLVGPTGGAGLSQAVRVKQVFGLLRKRTRGMRVCVYGEVGSVCPLLEVSGTSFFCFWLTDGSVGVPVLVQGDRLWWAQCVCAGQSVCVSMLRVCVLRSWRGNNILCVTEQSEIHTNYTHTHARDSTHTHTEESTQLDTPPLPMMSQLDMSPAPIMSQQDCEECEGLEPEQDLLQSDARVKQSRVISYQGTVTEVVSEGAGLYMIDRKVGLCLAYQPPPRRKLRAGDTVELHHVHFLYRPCPDLPPSMLCTCLRSSLRVTTFSRVSGARPESRCPGDGALPRLLLQKNAGVSEYLWTCRLSSQLSDSLLPCALQQCVCVLSWRLMEKVWRRDGGGRRDIYSEMLDQLHTCPLTQYRADPGVPQYTSVSDLSLSLQSDFWAAVPLTSLLPPGGSALTGSKVNAALAWAFRVLTSDPERSPHSGLTLRRRPLLLVGVLERPSQARDHSLLLRDRTGAVACVVTETSDNEEGGQTAVFNTAWIGCLVCVRNFSMVTERYIQSDFPSYQHLDQDKYIRHTRYRVYLQFSMDHLHVLSPSVAMVTHLGQIGGGTGQEAAGSSHTAPPSGTMATTSVSGSSAPCVSMVIRVEQKEGVTSRNVGAGLTDNKAVLMDEEAGLMPSFSLKASVVGPVVGWGRDPKNRPMTESEADAESEDKVVLVFSGVSARWFPLLQPGTFYRLIAPDTQDRSTLIGCVVSGRSQVKLHADPTLKVKSDWRFHTLTRPLLLHTYRQTRSPTVLSVSEVVSCRSELVCFQALVCDRIALDDRTSESGHTHRGVRLTMCDQAGSRLQVYLDSQNSPDPPGLLPGNTLLLSGFQRRESRSGGVYCRCVPVSSVSVLHFGDFSLTPPPPPPMMHLGALAVSRQRCIVGQVKGHVVCFLFLQLQWSCSLCGSVYKQSCCSSQCNSTSSVFDSRAKLVLEDGTGEAHVSFSGSLLPALLGLVDSQWVGLQRDVRLRGHVRVFPRGRSLVCDSDDPLLHFLLCVCSGDVLCRYLSLTCRKNSSQRAEEMKRFSRGDRDFMTRMTPPPQLTCLHIHTD